jgi:hypothetical protein
MTSRHLTTAYVAGTVPWPVGTLLPEGGRAALIERTGELIGYTPIHNTAGCPAMSVPLVAHQELPVGVHFAAAPGADSMLLELAYELELAEPWAHRRPDPRFTRPAPPESVVMKPQCSHRLPGARNRQLARLGGRFAAIISLASCAMSTSGADHATTSAPASAAVTSTVAAMPTSTDASTGEPSDPALRAELLEMLVLDQAVRTGELPPGDGRSISDLPSVEVVDSENQQRIVEIFDQHGWPGWRLVGRDGSTAAWAIVQHADFDLSLQERGLALLSVAVDADDASPGDLAYLTDRVLVAKGLPQVYGTQWGAPIENEAEVDQRRAAVGLDPLEQYLEELDTLPE